MTQLRGIEADFATWRPVQGRKVLQLIFEVPIEQTEQVLKMLGVPQPGDSKWCAIALLDPNAPAKPTQAVIDGDKQMREIYGKPALQAEGGPSKKWAAYTRSQQCAILCEDPMFQSYMGSPADEVAQMVRNHFRIKSRADLDKPENHARWDEFAALWALHRERHK